mmetsp:Transcript_63925/g.139063  ORF Transcript_63925/g.139063 Transcript_63925/m.139063 type:complete len:706 (+) Transcript_63925:323-2440(+)
MAVTSAANFGVAQTHGPRLVADLEPAVLPLASERDPDVAVGLGAENRGVEGALLANVYETAEGLGLGLAEVVRFGPALALGRADGHGRLADQLLDLRVAAAVERALEVVPRAVAAPGRTAPGSIPHASGDLSVAVALRPALAVLHPHVAALAPDGTPVVAGAASAVGRLALALGTDGEVVAEVEAVAAAHPLGVRPRHRRRALRDLDTQRVDLGFATAEDVALPGATVALSTPARGGTIAPALDVGMAVARLPVLAHLNVGTGHLSTVRNPGVVPGVAPQHAHNGRRSRTLGAELTVLAQAHPVALAAPVGVVPAPAIASSEPDHILLLGGELLGSAAEQRSVMSPAVATGSPRGATVLAPLDVVVELAVPLLTRSAELEPLVLAVAANGHPLVASEAADGGLLGLVAAAAEVLVGAQGETRALAGRLGVLPAVAGSRDGNLPRLLQRLLGLAARSILDLLKDALGNDTRSTTGPTGAGLALLAGRAARASLAGGPTRASLALASRGATRSLASAGTTCATLAGLAGTAGPASGATLATGSSLAARSRTSTATLTRAAPGSSATGGAGAPSLSAAACTTNAHGPTGASAAGGASGSTGTWGSATALSSRSATGSRGAGATGATSASRRPRRSSGTLRAHGSDRTLLAIVTGTAIVARLATRSKLAGGAGVSSLATTTSTAATPTLSNRTNRTRVATRTRWSRDGT